MNAVVDTNVLLVANGKHSEVSPECISTCAETLAILRARGHVFLDDGYLILSEYQQKTSPKQGTGPGDVFLKWLFQNLANPKYCTRVALRKNDQRGFDSFPDDTALKNFDPPDRKFVAVAAAASQRPTILQATDSKWVDWAPHLAARGVKVDFVCAHDIQRFHQSKTGGR